jgi:hypothetical protein
MFHVRACQPYTAPWEGSMAYKSDRKVRRVRRLGLCIALAVALALGLSPITGTPGLAQTGPGNVGTGTSSPLERTQVPQFLAGPAGAEVHASSFGNTNYYIDSLHGSDDNPGTTPDAPWRTLDRINAMALGPGDTVYLARGSTWTGDGSSAGTLSISGTGAPARPITVQAYGAGARPVLRNPGGASPNPSRVVVVRAPYVIVKDLLVRDARDGGIYLVESAHHTQVLNNEATAVGIGVVVTSQYNLIDGNYAHDLTMVVDDPAPDNDYGAQGVGLRAPNNEIAHNVFVNCLAPSHDYGTDGGAIEMFGTVDNTSIHHNTAFNDNDFIEAGGGSASNIVVGYNLIIQSGPAIKLQAGGSFASKFQNFMFVNNDVVDASAEGAYSLFYIYGTLSGPSPFLVANNIFYLNNYRMLVQGDTHFLHDRNIYYFTGQPAALNIPLNGAERIVDPMFANIKSGNFHLQKGSPAIDAGFRTAYSRDLAGSPVPSGSAPDIGALEAGK